MLAEIMQLAVVFKAGLLQCFLCLSWEGPRAAKGHYRIEPFKPPQKYVLHPRQGSRKISS
jgi:hypothetical protein